jgi:hypothetical protein
MCIDDVTWEARNGRLIKWSIIAPTAIASEKRSNPTHVQSTGFTSDGRVKNSYVRRIFVLVLRTPQPLVRYIRTEYGGMFGCLVHGHVEACPFEPQAQPGASTVGFVEGHAQPSEVSKIPHLLSEG